MCVPCVQSKPCPVFCLNLWKRLINLAVKLIYIMPFHVSLIQRRTTPFLGLKVELPADPLKDWAFWIAFYVRPWISPYLSPLRNPYQPSVYAKWVLANSETNQYIEPCELSSITSKPLCFRFFGRFCSFGRFGYTFSLCSGTSIILISENLK